MMVEIDTLRYLAPCDTEQYRSSSIATSRPVSLKRKRRFLTVWRLHQDELVFPYVIEDALDQDHYCCQIVVRLLISAHHSLPHADDGFHVEITREEDNDAVRGDFGELR